jgi:hypothetical protein
MSETITDIWKQKLAESAPPEDEPVEMTFDGLPCKVRPLGMDFYIKSGRMPAHLASTTLYLQARDEAGVNRALENVSPEEMLKGQQFQRVALCRALVEPKVVDVPPGEEPEGAFSFMELAERRPGFVDGVFFWLLAGCPVPVKGGEGDGLDAEALGNFPEGERRTKRARSRRDRKGHGKDAVAAHPQQPS